MKNNVTENDEERKRIKTLRTRQGKDWNQEWAHEVKRLRGKGQGQGNDEVKDRASTVKDSQWMTGKGQ